MQTIHTKVSCTVKSSLSHAWSQLWRKASSPQDFIEGIDSVQILEHSQNVIVRVMKMKGITIKERITRDEGNGTVRFSNVQGSDLQGNVYNRVRQNGQGEVELVFQSSARSEDNQPMPKAEMFQKALERTKSVIEKTLKA